SLCVCVSELVKRRRRERGRKRNWFCQRAKEEEAHSLGQRSLIATGVSYFFGYLSLRLKGRSTHHPHHRSKGGNDAKVNVTLRLKGNES
uniref:Uncharacterized protein n=1 Tax=Anopheles atroparvus TaxID=41427 RepID=A0AAG5CW25_ANOAO